jgi:hypothetical protein
VVDHDVKGSLIHDDILDILYLDLFLGMIGFLVKTMGGLSMFPGLTTHKFWG